MSLSRPITAMVACTCDVMQLESAVHADTIFIVQRRDGDVMISLFAGDDRPEEATEAVSKQVSTATPIVYMSTLLAYSKGEAVDLERTVVSSAGQR